ncbi:hypothetical protein E0493_19165 [Roseomonas sp. M0104]|uniref:Uncharacterized protein n=1 Tax=Teichococcus coralli TaxID=2545983 RepID=A0A845BJX9_9PROT|nr:hypothetical protein [Pseudoroseomonas coralli]MXP65472.1 hypothetical protein [Pseudoroseomonas coralli]
MSDEAAGRRALEALDKVLEKKPHKDDHALSAAMEGLCAWRDSIAAEHRRGGAAPKSRERLARINVVISVVVGSHFPLGDTPWEELQKARGWLSELLEPA